MKEPWAFLKKKKNAIPGPHDHGASASCVCMHCNVCVSVRFLSLPVLSLSQWIYGIRACQGSLCCEDAWAWKQDGRLSEASERHRCSQMFLSSSAARRAPLPPPLPLPNPSWLSVTNFRDTAVWETPELHRYHTYDSCQFNMSFSPLTFDWRMPSDLHTLASDIDIQTFSWSDIEIFNKLTDMFLTMERRLVSELLEFSETEHISNISTHAYTSSHTPSLLSCRLIRCRNISYHLCCTSLPMICANSGTVKPPALVGPECWPEIPADTHVRYLLCVHHLREAKVSGIVASL